MVEFEAVILNGDKSRVWSPKAQSFTTDFEERKSLRKQYGSCSYKAELKAAKEQDRKSNLWIGFIDIGKAYKQVIQEADTSSYAVAKQLNIHNNIKQRLENPAIIGSLNIYVRTLILENPDFEEFKLSLVKE